MPVTINGTTGVATPAVSSTTITTTGAASLTSLSVAGSNLSGTNGIPLRNRITNGDMRVAQRATSATVTAGTAVPTASTGFPCVDRFFVYSTGANVTAAQVSGTGTALNRLQITGAASVTAIGVGQRIERINSVDLAGGSATLSVDLSNSLLTTVTWTANYANTNDVFGTVGTPTKTQIATGTFTVSSTITNYTATFSVPSAATTGIEIVFTVGAQTSGTWVIGNVQLEAGTVATPYERVDYGLQFIQCQRYYQSASSVNLYMYIIDPGTNNTYRIYSAIWPVRMRASPTFTSTPTATGGTTLNATGWQSQFNGVASGTFYSISAYTASAEL